MNKMNSFLKTSALVMFAVVIISGCTKKSDPYADYTPAREAGLISDWLTAMVDKNNDIDTTSTGLYYIVDRVGSGAKVTVGDTVTVKYIGMFMDGSVFDASAYHASSTNTVIPHFSADSTYTYIHQSPNSATLSMIKGWEEGIEVMNKGERAAFLLPSAKAYGAYGSDIIPPYTPLIFSIEVVDIK
ncbi:MAG TPA: FKBP-type peptidyl-prolyl cis-trans isomerase [Prolixibacteraceae bacterium]|nr:FKBP-type peptidyl-prolyl cis-trans isomerase [Prolixibacteraceae bacterium]